MPYESQSQLRERAGEAIRRGELPRVAPKRRFYSSGEGTTCVVCRRPINSDQLQVEPALEQGSVGEGSFPHPVHVPCFTAWELALLDVNDSAS